MPVAAVAPSQDHVRVHSMNMEALKGALAEQASDAKNTHVTKAVAALNQHVDQLRGQNVDVALLLKPEDVVKLEEAKRFGLAADYVAGLDNFLASGVDHTHDAQGVNLSATLRDRANAALAASETGAGVVTGSGSATGVANNVDPGLQKIAASLDAFPALTAAEKTELDQLKNDPDPAKRDLAMSRLAIEATATQLRGQLAEMKKSGSLADITCFLKGDFEGLSVDAKREVMKEVKTRNKDLPRDQRISLDDVVAEHGERLHEMQGQITGALAGLTTNTDPVIAGLANAAAAGNSAAMLDSVKALGNDALATGATAAKLDGNLPESVKNAIKGLEDSRRDYQDFAERNYSEIVALINSNLPIEMIVCLVLLKLAERQREKVKLKMKELAASEAMEAAKDSKSIYVGVEEKVMAENPGLSGDALEKKVKSTKDQIKADHDNRLQQSREEFKIPQMQTAIQSLQFQQNQLKQFMDALSNVLRVIQDMAATPIRHIR